MTRDERSRFSRKRVVAVAVPGDGGDKRRGERGGDEPRIDALTAPLRPLSEAWRGVVRAPQRRAVVAAASLVVVAALLVARVGTAKARVAGGVAMLATVALVLLLRRRESALWSDPKSVIARVAGRVDPERAQRALRALTLIGADGEPHSPGTSAPLARLHVERALAALPVDKVAQGAAIHATRLAIAGGLLALGTFGVFVSNPWGIVEGGDILFAQKGAAPMSMMWLGGLELRARPPEYLHEEEHHLRPFTDLELPRGTLVTFRGAPTHAGRRLLLTDGANEVPFVDDGTGRMVARWPLAESVTLRVVARFGDVVISEPDATPVTSIADKAPIVTLEGAPRSVSLASALESPEIPIRYEVTDDHGLREVHLVLRSGTREERRVLARLDGEARVDRGGHILRASDPFLKKSHAPIEVRVEAKDNDPITGPKWGASDAITILPPDVGEPEAKRLDALRKLRDALVDTLAWRLENAPPISAADRRAFVAELLKSAESSSDLAEATITTSYAGVRVAPRLQAIVRGQLRKVRNAVDAEARGLSAPAHAATIKASERIVLVIDAMLRGLGVRDSKDTAKQLADVADDLVVGFGQMRSSSDVERGTARADAAVSVLGGGSKSLLQLGMLGRDLGEIVSADLSRVARARKDGDVLHAEIAARDLAARLHMPDPSFGSKGSGRGGGESGGGRGTPGEAGEDTGNDADQAFNEAERDLERLAQDHAGGIGNVEQALSGAASEEDVKALAEDAKKHASAVREATHPLPTVGGGSDSWTSKGAAAREHGEQMARSLEQGNPADAVASGRNAMQALDEAKRTAQRERWSTFSGGDNGADKKIDEAKKKLEPEVKWAEEKLEGLRKKAAERASSELSKGGDDEGKLADRAGQLGTKGRDQGGLPAAALDSLDAAEKAAREAAQALKRGDADKGLEHQREAQRMLEMAKEALGGSQEGDKGQEGDGETSNDHADIPKADAHKGPEEFRRRVIKGLGQPSSGLHKDAIRRYAEGLLR